MKKVLLTSTIHPAAIAFLESNVDIIIAPNTSEDTLSTLARKVDGMVARASARINRQIIETTENLCVISRTGAGVDNVDLTAAASKGIVVCSLPGMNALTVAEHAVTLILSLAKQLGLMDRSVREERWQARTQYAPIDVCGKTLGLVGAGNIGSHVARICAEGLGMNVIAYDPLVSKQMQTTGYLHFVSDLPTIFRMSDFVSLHIPSSPATHHLVNQQLLSTMKKTAYLVNTSRGDIVDESALTCSLQQGRIAGAGLDVFQQEPPLKSNPLLALPNVLFSPHSASLTGECVERLATGAAQAVIDVLSGQMPLHIANENELRKAGSFPNLAPKNDAL